MHPRDLAHPEISTTVRKEDLKTFFAMDFQQRTLSLALNTLSIFSPDLSASHALELFTKTRYKNSKRRGVFADIEPDILSLEGENIAIYCFAAENKNAPTALLVHGWEGQASDYYKVVPKLAKAGINVVAFDGPAHGLSSGSSSNMFHFIEVIESITKYYGGFDYCIGHSMGGVAIAMANQLSQNFNPEKMIIMGSPNKLEVVIEKFAKYLSLNKNIINSMFKHIESLVGLKVQNISLEKVLKHQENELLLVYDIDDKMVPFQRAEEILEKVPHANLMKTFGLGHVNILRDDEVIDRIVSFLKG